MISAMNKVTFIYLLQNIYDKAAFVNVPLKPKMDFLSSPLIAIDEIADKLNNHMKKYMESPKINQVCQKVSKNENIKKRINKKFNIINYEQTMIIKKTFRKISKNIDYVPSENDDQQFVERFNEWKEDIPDKQQIKKIKNELKTKEKNYRQLRKISDVLMKTVFQVLKSIETDKSTVNLLCNDILGEIHSENATKIAEKLVTQLDRIRINLLNLFQWLKNMEYCLLKYNIDRKAWADFLIGIREMPKCERQPKNSPMIVPVDKNIDPVEFEVYFDKIWHRHHLLTC